jgi:hypothetical protein
LPLRRKECPGIRGDDRNETEHSTSRVGELGRLAYLETIDPPDAGHPRGEPTGHHHGVHYDDAPRSRTSLANQRPETNSHLEHSNHDEDLRELAVLGVDAGGRRMNCTRSQRSEAGERDDRDAPLPRPIVMLRFVESDTACIDLASVHVHVIRVRDVTIVSPAQLEVFFSHAVTRSRHPMIIDL